MKPFAKKKHICLSVSRSITIALNELRLSFEIIWENKIIYDMREDVFCCVTQR